MSILDKKISIELSYSDIIDLYSGIACAVPYMEDASETPVHVISVSNFGRIG